MSLAIDVGECAVVTWPVAAVGAALRGRWPTRSAVILTIARGAMCGFGEAAPLPGFGRDSLTAAIADVQRWLDGDRTPCRSRSAQFAIDTATASLAAAIAREPLASNWQRGARASVDNFAAVIDSVADIAPALAAGATALKVKLTGHDDRARLAAIRAEAPTIALRADANQCWPHSEVGVRLHELRSLGLEYVEEPAVDFVATLATLATPLAVPIALDESLADLDPDDPGLARALATGAVAALVLKPTVLGIDVCRRFAATASAAGVDAVMSHALEGAIGFAAVRHFAGGLSSRLPSGLGPHPALAAWGPLPATAIGLGIEPDAIRRAIARLRCVPS